MASDYITILNELNKTVKALNFYPKGHPNLDNVLKNCLEILKEKAVEENGLTWKVDMKGFYSGDTLIAPARGTISGLAKLFFLRRIKVLNISPDLTQTDIAGFFEVLKMEPDEVFSQGGAEKVLVKKGVAGLLLNEMNYDRLKEIQEEVEKEREAEEEAALEEGTSDQEVEEAEEEGAEEDAEEGAEEPAEQAAEPEPPIIPEAAAEVVESLNSLLDKVDKEKEYVTYNNLATEILPITTELMEENHFDETFPALYIFTKHSMPRFGLADDIREKAEEYTVQLLTGDMLNYLVLRLGQKEEKHRPALEQMILRAGVEGFNLLLDTLIATQSAQERRNIFNSLVNYGELIRPLVVERLGDEQWFVVRQMVSLLGELGGEESIEPLRKCFDHSDVRVRKEVLKSLARIPSPRSSQILKTAIQEGSRALQGQAIISLGILRDTSSVEILGEIAAKGFSENMGLRKEAVKALGIIGDEKAVPYLKKLLKKVWFGKTSHEEMRSIAVVALGKIGTEEALGAIEETSEDSTGTLYSTCKRVLEGRR